MKKVSLIIACYNEAENIPLVYQRITDVFNKLPNYTPEIIFVDNASTDASRQLIRQLAEKDTRVMGIFMSRNFGNSQPSYLAGLRTCTGDAVVLLDGDLQDPPEVIPQFITEWEKGAQVVYGVRVKRQDSMVLRFFYYLFYRIFRMLSYLDIPLDAGDFGLIERRVVEVMISLPEKDVYLRGLRAWVGFRQVGVPYLRQGRYAGISTNKFLGNFYWFKKAIVNFSYKPLEYISFLALLGVLFSGCAGLWYVYLALTRGAPQGFTTLLVVMLLIGTLQFVCFGVIAEYLIRIFEEVKNRPPYVIQEIVNNPHQPAKVKE